MNHSLEILKKRSGWRASLVIDAKLSSREDFYQPRNSKEISNPADLQLLKRLRSLADVIVTTGKTARIENYIASKFAPIAVLTEDESKVRKLPLFESQQNFTLSLQKPLSLDDLEAALRQQGYGSFLFEGGLQVLDQLLEQAENFELVLSVTGVEPNQTVASAKYLEYLFPACSWKITNEWSDSANQIIVAELTT